MKVRLALIILIWGGVALPIVGHANELAGISEKLNELAREASAETPELGNASPDGKLTNFLNELSAEMANLSAIAEESAEADSNKRRELTALLVKGDELSFLLEERRSFRYLLWAEMRLRRSISLDLSELSQRELFGLYKSLSDINLSLVSEVILSREITAQLVAIYDRLDAEHKPDARLESIRRNADEKLAQESGFARRKGLDDF